MKREFVLDDTVKCIKKITGTRVNYISGNIYTVREIYNKLGSVPDIMSGDNPWWVSYFILYSGKSHLPEYL